MHLPIRCNRNGHSAPDGRSARQLQMLPVRWNYGGIGGRQLENLCRRAQYGKVAGAEAQCRGPWTPGIARGDSGIGDDQGERRRVHTAFRRST